MQKNILLVCLLICFKITYAQNTNFKWVKTFQANKQSIVFTNQFAVDSKNNIYTVGVFEGSVNFAGPFGNFWLSTNKDTNRLGKMNTKDMFITKHDVNGNFIWAKYLGGPNDEYVSSLTIDKFDNVYLAGLYEEEVDFNPDTGRFILSSAIHGNTFILKLDSGGKFIWAKSITSSVGIGIRIDFENNIIGGGFNQGKVDLKPGTDSFIIKKNGSFLFKLDNNGNFIWGKHLEGDILRFSALETDTLGNIYSCGTFMYHRSDFDPGPDSFIMKPTTNVQIYISKLNKFGDFVWAKQVGGQKDNPYYDTDLDIDQHGNVYTYGHFESTCDFDPGAGVYNLVGKLQFDPITHSRFVLKLNSNGNFEWAKKLEIGHHTPGNLIRSDKSGGIYLGGIFSGIIDFDPGLGISNLISTQGFEKASGTYYSSDAFILKLDEWGNYVWSKKIGGPDFDRIYRLFLDKQRNIYGLGIFSDTFSYNIKNRDTIDFNPGGPNGKVYGWGNFILKYEQTVCSNLALIIDTATNISCITGPGYISSKTLGGLQPYSYIWNTIPVKKNPSSTFDSRGHYTLTVSDSLGCKNSSTVILDGPLYRNGFDLAAYLSTGSLRPGRNSTITLTALNEGCTIINGILKLNLDSQLIFHSANPKPDSIKGNMLTWKTTLLTSDSMPFNVELNVIPKTILQSGDSVDLALSVSPFKDGNQLNNFKTYRFGIVNSYDPNNKIVYPAGECKKKYVIKNKPLTYTINFQNTGTAEAIDIFIIDTINYNLDIKSLRVIGQSHPQLITEVFHNKFVRFKFNNINLPDSNFNEKGSHGFVIYEIYPDSSAPNENIVSGNAGIFFDFNEPVYTNYVMNTLTNKIPVCPFKVGINNPTKTLKNHLFPNPCEGKFSIILKETSRIKIYDQQSILLYSEMHFQGTRNIDISGLPNGIYFVEVNHQKFKLIKLEY